MARESIDVQLTPSERSLLLRYGYPFARIEQALKAVSASKAIEIVPLDRFELERLIDDLSCSMNKMNGGRIQDQLFTLCDRLEAAERYGDGMLDTL